MKVIRHFAKCVLLCLAAAPASAQVPPGGFVGFPGSPPLPPLPPPRPDRGFPGFFVYEHDYEPVIEREIIREVPAPAPAPPPPPRKPYVLGRTYDALPGGCMKLIQDGGSYYLCSGEWYRPLGGGRYLAIAQP